MMRKSTMMTNCGRRGTIIRSMPGYRKERVQKTSPKERGRRSGQDGGRGPMSKIWNSVMEDGDDRIDED